MFTLTMNPFPSPVSPMILGPKNYANAKETRVLPPVRGPTRERGCAGAARAVRTARHRQGLVHRIFGAGPSAQIVRFASLNISPGVACWCLIGSASSSHERRARDMDLPTGPGLFIDDNDWFRPARTSPFRPAGKSCVRRHSRGYSRSAEQQSHITRALCTGSARGRVRTCMEVPDPGRASRRGYIQSVFHGSLSDLDDRDRLASRPISAQNHGELGQIASRSLSYT